MRTRRRRRARERHVLDHSHLLVQTFYERLLCHRARVVVLVEKGGIDRISAAQQELRNGHEGSLIRHGLFHELQAHLGHLAGVDAHKQRGSWRHDGAGGVAQWQAVAYGQ
eukprot:scaffold81434_cov57-Phaeocystis_antarctica.AAC.6